MPETVDAAEIQRRNLGGEFAGAFVEGPLSFDLAYSNDAGGKKRVEGEVVGRADAMVFPDLLSANLTVKAIMYTAAVQFGGVLRGTTAPVAFMSRADTTATRLNSLALALAILENGAGTDPD
jgi:phosphate butyryltransferase